MQQHRPQGNGQVVTMMRTTASTQPQIIIVACCITLRRSGYDTAGNIRSITRGGTTLKSFGYTNPSWPDLLTSVTSGSTTKSIQYEGQTRSDDGVVSGDPVSGNPLWYYNGKEYTFTWTKGRQLAKAVVDGKTVEYTYDMSGVRTSKTVNGTTYNYTTLSGKVMRQQWGSKSLEFVYDDGNQPFAMIYNDGSTSAVTDGMSTLTTGVISKYTDDSYDKSWGHIVGTALFDAGSSALTSNSVRVPKVTVGCGNMNAVFRAGLTKIKRHQAKRMSSRVMRKGFFSLVVGGVHMSAWRGIRPW